MLNYDEFKEYIKNHISEYLPENVTYNVELITQTKNNNTVLNGLSIRVSDEKISPTIYLNSFYENYENGFSIQECLESLVHTYLQAKWKGDINTEQFTDWAIVKNHIVCKLVNKENNEKYLEDKPHKIFGNLTCMYGISGTVNADESYFCPITNDLFKCYDISLDELHEIALNNSREQYPFTLNDMHSVLDSLMGATDEKPVNYFSPENLELPLPESFYDLFVLSNQDKTNGAIALLYPDILDVLAKKIGGDFYILPSSIHEVLIVPKSEGDLTWEDFQNMVSEINATELDPVEILTDSVYEYDAKEHLLFYDGDKNNVMLLMDDPSVQKKGLAALIDEASKSINCTNEKNDQKITLERCFT